ncbi:MAG: alpha/beta fold hydrolase [Gammaproteobacteria bacterium]
MNLSLLPGLVLLLASGTVTAQAPPGDGHRLGALDFHACELGGEGVPVLAARCARLRVAENPAAPQGRQIELAVAWLPARGSRPQPDALVFLAGGPGQSALQSYPLLASALQGLRSDRHVILLDQRGTGGSNRLACALPDWRDATQLSSAALRAQALDCRQTLSERADLRYYTTADYVRDLETLRQTLGIPQFNLLAGSYGTRVALEYLRRHPQAIRSAVLDGVVPPRLALLQDHAQNLEQALAAQFARCAASASCHQRFGPLDALLTRLRERLRQQPLRVRYADPRRHTPREELLSEDLLKAVVRLFAYAPESVALLPLLLHEADQGRPQALMAQAQLLIDSLEGQLAHGMELSVLCTEDAPFLQRRPEDAATLLGETGQELAEAQCAVWPRGELAADFKQPVRARTPVLLLSGEYDPVTPPRYAAEVAADLPNSRQLLAPGQGHIVLNRGCMPRLVRRFVEQLQPAALDAACLDALDGLPAFETYLGAGP